MIGLLARPVRRFVLPVTAFVIAGIAVTACGSSGGGGGGGSSDTIIRGTTDIPVSFDPAGAYDIPSYDMLANVYQTLLTIPPGGSEPKPEAAQSCQFVGKSATTYECKLKPGLKFSDGSALTAEDVVFSFERNTKIAAATGASSLLANLESVEEKGSDTVVFKLKEPDATWPSLISAPAFSIVPSDVYSMTDLQDEDATVGSGRYEVVQSIPGQQTVLEANPEYHGPQPPIEKRAIVEYFDKPSALKLAIENGDVDVAYRSFSPTDLESLKKASGVEVVEGKSAEIRYLTFNLGLQEGSDAEKTAIRQAVAQVIDREAIAKNVYNGTVEPLYSMVPQGIPFATEAFAEAYGKSPNVSAAGQTLSKAGVTTPVPLEIWWTPSHYGPAAADEFAEIKRQLDGSKLFKVTLKSTEWDQYSEAALTDQYPVFQLGWVPNFPDAHDYLQNLEGEESYLNNGYDNRKVFALLDQEKATADQSAREAPIDQIQQIVAEEAPTIPIWQGNQVAVEREGVEGVEKTFDPSFIFRLWLLSKKG